MRPTIYIDADACPVTSETLAVARKNALPAVVAGNATQNLARHIRRGDPREPRDGFWVDTLPVGIGADAADFAIVQELEPGDIVVTQDIGLAAMALGRHARAIGARVHADHHRPRHAHPPRGEESAPPGRADEGSRRLRRR